MADASSPCSASTSRELRSKLRAHRCRSARASISCAVILTLSPARSTEPSTIGVDVERLRDLRGRRPTVALELHRRAARDHAQLADAGEVRGQLVGHPLGEVVLAGIARVVVEREDGDRSDPGLARRLRRASGRTHDPGPCHQVRCPSQQDRDDRPRSGPRASAALAAGPRRSAAHLRPRTGPAGRPERPAWSGSGRPGPSRGSGRRPPSAPPAGRHAEWSGPGACRAGSPSRAPPRTLRRTGAARSPSRRARPPGRRRPSGGPADRPETCSGDM